MPPKGLFIWTRWSSWPAYRDELCGVFIWEILARSTGMNSTNTTKLVEHKLVLFSWCVDSCNFTNKANSHIPKVEIHTRPKLCHFCRYVVRAKLFCLKSFVPVSRLECSYMWENFHPGYTEISVSGAAQPLIWTHRYFYKEKSAHARSRDRASPVDRAHLKRP